MYKHHCSIQTRRIDRLAMAAVVAMMAMSLMAAEAVAVMLVSPKKFEWADCARALVEASEMG